ncbi:MAG: DUF5018 domain-containing protein [Bacteroidota bacterium]
MKKMAVLVSTALVLLVSCTNDDESVPQKSSEKAILSFSFLEMGNTGLDKDVNAEIDQDQKTITATMPWGTSLNALRPTIAISTNATIGPNDKEMVDFSETVEYTVTAEDGSTQVYSVTLTLAPVTDRDVLMAWYNANPGNTLSWDFSKEIEEWEGITLSDEKEGRVFGIALKGNSLPHITPLIGHLSELHLLTLLDTGIGQVPPEIGDLEKLILLDLTGNEISELPKEIGNLENLFSLKMHNNRLIGLPKEVGNLKELVELDLTFNTIQELSVEIGDLDKLRSLSVYGNRDLMSVPKEIGQLTELENLDLGYCDLSSIPMEVGNLSKLTHLRIDENQLMALPKELGQLGNLVSLKVQINQLTYLPRALGQLEQLLEFNISQNPIEVIPREICELDDVNLILIKDPNVPCESK